ncbi:MAG: NAD(P)/FAD-dependent oxidoreductase [Acholeplasmataceae bacterium]|nr:NAD(P)/FAD-dependent oxidoreductase [Acholeplasmataceae bacterium]
MSNKVCVIGAGASGILAAISAKEQGADVFMLERNTKIGKKILATGNGRCNFTNVDATEYNYNHPEFVKSIFEQFGPDHTVKFFENLGIIPKIEDLGKAYPYSEQAASIVEVLLHELKKLGIEIIFEIYVQEIKIQNNKYIIKTQHKEFKADKVILTTGGKALPKSGSDGNGYIIAKKLGHEITEVFPSLVKLNLDYPYLKQMDGVKVKAKAQLIFNEQVVHEESGDVLFTKFGISGPTILQISRFANQLLLENKTIYIKVILINDLKVFELVNRFKNLNDKSIEMALVGLIPNKLIHPLLKEADIFNFNQKTANLSGKDLKKVLDILYDWRFLIVNSKGFDDAQVTAGGIDLAKVDQMTLESKVHKGLFFAGEVLDIDALCGGYNLQWAWSSGYIAGKYAGKKI